MGPELWSRVSSALDRLLPLPKLEWRTKVEDIRQSDPDVARELDGLLSTQHAENGHRLEDLFNRLGAARSLEPNDSFDSYRILGILGRGGFGTVYRAEHVRMRRLVALKILSDGFAQDARTLTRFDREIQVVARLDHPNVVRAFDAGECNGRHFLAMECLEGSDLRAVLRDRGPLPPTEACELIRQAALGLHHAHGHGLVHRDVKPSNLWRTPDGRVRVLDLGLARVESAELASALTCGVMGTLDYIAPEQAEDAHAVDARADVYGLGATLYNLIVGTPPFADVPDDRPLAKLRIVAERPAPPLVGVRTALPDGLAELVARMLAKRPVDRPPSAAAVADALLPFTVGAEDPVPGARPIPPTPKEAIPEEGRRYAPARGALPLDSPFYIQRPADAEFRAALDRLDSIVRIKGPRQVGKTSLLARGVDQAEQAGRRIAVTDLQSLNESDFASADTFYMSVGTWMAQSLDRSRSPADVWNPRLAANLNFERFVGEALGQIDRPIVWVIDEVDRLFNRGFAGDVFSLLRTWHNQRALNRRSPFCRLTVVLGYATEADLFVTDLHQSPFNVGTPIALADFLPEQVADLNRRYGSPLVDAGGLDRFKRLVNGHPYLVHYGLYWLASSGRPLADLEAEAAEDQGPFGEHLRRLRVLLARVPDLAAALRELARGASVAPGAFYRLRSAGVLVGNAPRAASWRCPLYATYLERHLP